MTLLTIGCIAAVFLMLGGLMFLLSIAIALLDICPHYEVDGEKCFAFLLLLVMLATSTAIVLFGGL